MENSWTVGQHVLIPAEIVEVRDGGWITVAYEQPCNGLLFAPDPAAPTVDDILDAVESMLGVICVMYPHLGYTREKVLELARELCVKRTRLAGAEEPK